MVLPQEGAKPSKKTRMIAVVMPNDQSIDHDWTKYRVSVEDVEELTGYRFFPDIPDEITSVIKAEADSKEIKVAPFKPAKKKKSDGE